MSGTAAALGVAGVVTAPMEAPTLLVGGTALAVSQGISFLSGASGEMARAMEEERFQQRYGFPKGELKWSVLPVGACFWHLAAGDGALELILKAKRGPLGLGSNAAKLERLLRATLRPTGEDAPHMAARVEVAVQKAEADCAGNGLRPALEPATRFARELRDGPRWPSWVAAPVAGVVVAEPIGEVDPRLPLAASGQPFGAAPTSASAEGWACALCLDGRHTHALVPCGHKCLCAECSLKYAAGGSCPICRAPVESVMRVWD